MITRLSLIVSALLSAVFAVAVAAPQASAAPRDCSDVEVLFARGTMETAPPVGSTGLSFANALKAQLPGKKVAVRGVRYPASADFQHKKVIVKGVLSGVSDAQQRIETLARRCPRTKVVLGGYSQGAVVASYAVSDRVAVPAAYRGTGVENPTPLSKSAAARVAAVVLFAPPSNRWIRDIGAPSLRVGTAFTSKTKTYCIPGDTVCDGSPVGQPNALHILYQWNGMQIDAAHFAAARI